MLNNKVLIFIILILLVALITIILIHQHDMNIVYSNCYAYVEQKCILNNIDWSMVYNGS